MARAAGLAPLWPAGHPLVAVRAPIRSARRALAEKFAPKIEPDVLSDRQTRPTVRSGCKLSEFLQGRLPRLMSRSGF